MSDPEIEFTPWRPPVFWSCARGASIADIGRALGGRGGIAFELSARTWTDDVRMMEDVARTFSFPDYFGYNEHALIDCFGDVRDQIPRFVVVIRDIPDSEHVRSIVELLADTIGPENPDRPEQCVVLEGWGDGVIRTYRKDEFEVRPLKTA